MIRKNEWGVRVVDHAAAAAFIQQFHYARGCSKTSVFRFGLFPRDWGDLMLGVTMWLPPTRVVAESVDADRWARVLALSRMAVFPALGRNACSFMLARAIGHIEATRKWSALVTYADESQGHEGRVYRASGWEYCGRTGPYPRWVDPASGRQVATQATRTRSASEMRDLGYVNTGSFFKHKFVRRLRRLS